MTVILLIATILFAQAPDTLWTRTYGGAGQDSCWSAQYTADHGFILAGWTDSYGAGGHDFYLVKTDLLGDTVWTRTFGGTDVDECLAVIQTFDGGYVAGGRTLSFGTDYDVWLIKTDAQGDTQWTKTIGGSGYDMCRGLYQTSDSGFILTGTTNSYGADSFDIYLIRTDKNGDALWTKTFGGPLNENGYTVTQTIDGGFLIAGWTQSFGAGNYDAYIIKIDPSGDSLWSFLWGGTSMDKGCSVIEANDGSYMIAGWTYSFGPDVQNAYLLKMTTTGDTVWTKYYGDDVYSVVYSVQKTTDGGYILAGTTGSSNPTADVYLVKTDSMGDMQWSTRYGGNGQDCGWSAEQTDDGSYYIAGWTGSFGSGGADFYLVRTGLEQNILEDKKICPYISLNLKTAIFCSPLRLPAGKTYRVFDITGRAVMPNMLKPGVYFIEIDGVITGKVVKVR
ncbi:MAG TPA: hypothetical protein VF399_01465 [bacterium]